MALLLTTHPFPDTTLGIWHISESESVFRAELPLSAQEEAELSNLQHVRRMEWLASRWMLHLLTGAFQRLPLAKDAFSKPFFLDNPDLFCSLSHSQGVAGAMIAAKNCGCDIQVIVKKMPKIAHKFLGVAEANFVAAFSEEVQLELFHLYWTAKESLFKAYGIKALDFRAHIFVQNMIWDGYSGSAKGLIKKNDVQLEYDLRFGKLDFDAGSLVWATCL